MKWKSDPTHRLTVVLGINDMWKGRTFSSDPEGGGAGK